MDKKSKTILVICIIVMVIALGIITSYALIKENFSKAKINKVDNIAIEDIYCNLSI